MIHIKMTQIRSVGVRYERIMVKNRVHAAGNLTFLPRLATF
jgi:hypothetical protein